MSDTYYHMGRSQVEYNIYKLNVNAECSLDQRVRVNEALCHHIVHQLWDTLTSADGWRTWDKSFIGITWV